MVLKAKRDETPPVQPSMPSTKPLRFLRGVGIATGWFVLALLILWATAAIYIDFRIESLRVPLTLIYVLGIIAILIKFKRIPLGGDLMSRELFLRSAMVAHS